jgi:hypothetical protein
MTRAMSKLVLALMASGCWTSSSQSSAPSASAPLVAESDTQDGSAVSGTAASDAQYGGTTYGAVRPANQLGILGSMKLEQGETFSSMSETGSGTGTGSNAMVPTVAVGQPAAQGSLDKEIIRRHVKRNLGRIRYCYEKQLLAEPALQGTVTVQFVIGVDGDVTSSSGSGMHPEVASCVATAIKAIRFPKPAGGGHVDVRYPFVFQPG